jgi:hypothetical protein
MIIDDEFSSPARQGVLGIVVGIMTVLWSGASFGAPPVVVIDHYPASSGMYIGSPSLVVLPDGSYRASHDLFGPKSTEYQKAVSIVFSSTDQGRSWKKISDISGQFWSTLFAHRGMLYFLGTDKHHGNAIIRRSADGGITWTTPLDANTGLLRGDGQYHCAPMAVVEHGGRLWRPMEIRDPPEGWGSTYCAGMLSASSDADLLAATNWTFSNFLPGNTNWLAGEFGGWLEGNAIVTREGRMLDILRVETPGFPERAAMVDVSDDGRKASFNPASGFIHFPGGAKKFTIRYDPESDAYWSLSSVVPEPAPAKKRPGIIRNNLALTRSRNLRDWEVRSIVLHHGDTARHGFQYVDWQFEGNDLIAVCRTASDDESGGAHNYHDANFLTFHRILDFRTKSMADGPPSQN